MNKFITLYNENYNVKRGWECLLQYARENNIKAVYRHDDRSPIVYLTKEESEILSYYYDCNDLTWRQLFGGLDSYSSLGLLEMFESKDNGGSTSLTWEYRDLWFAYFQKHIMS